MDIRECTFGQSDCIVLLAMAGCWWPDWQSAHQYEWSSPKVIETVIVHADEDAICESSHICPVPVPHVLVRVRTGFLPKLLGLLTTNVHRSKPFVYISLHVHVVPIGQ
jgi:hypothetical protein